MADPRRTGDFTIAQGGGAGYDPTRVGGNFDEFEKLIDGALYGGGTDDVDDIPLIRERVNVPWRTFNPKVPGSFEIADPDTHGFAKQGNVTDTYANFKSEYALRISEDPGFEDWIKSRAYGMGFDVINGDGSFNVRAGESFWEYAGMKVAMNPTLRGTVTPEEYADGIYQSKGGDDAYQKFLDAKAKAAERNPISITTSTSYNTMEPAAAEAAVDQLARGLLGRMASEKEMNRYRKQINAFLKANPSTSRTVTNADTQTSDSVSHAGASQADAMNILEQRLRRGSEGMAYNVGKMWEDAMTIQRQRENM